MSDEHYDPPKTTERKFGPMQQEEIVQKWYAVMSLFNKGPWKGLSKEPVIKAILKRIKNPVT